MAVGIVDSNFQPLYAVKRQGYYWNENREETRGSWGATLRLRKPARNCGPPYYSGPFGIAPLLATFGTAYVLYVPMRPCNRRATVHGGNF